MFLLFLGLGTASVKAQVRIGGNAAPNASAVLDLNATDATNNGTKGLALPRVGLTSNTMLLPGVTANLTGMLVYNTTTTGGAGVNTIGIYFWNGATWVKASLPSTSAADSGLFLMSNGSSFVTRPLMLGQGTAGYAGTATNLGSVTWTKVVDTVIRLRFRGLDGIWINVSNRSDLDFCKLLGNMYWISSGGNGISYFFFSPTSYSSNPPDSVTMRLVCYRPSM